MTWIAVGLGGAIGAVARYALNRWVLERFTTFSSFSLDTLELVRTGHPGAAAVNVIGQVGLSIAAATLGYRLAS